MPHTLKHLEVKFAESQQERSQQTLQNLIEAAEQLVDSSESDNLTVRNLALVSGYSLGSIAQRLGKVENVFLHTIAHGRQKHLIRICSQLESFDKDASVEKFSEYLVDICLEGISKVGASIIRYYENRALGRTNCLADIHAYTDSVIPTLLRVTSKNTTGTFREISLYQAKYVSRAIFTFIERPFAESDPLAGTKEHREMAVAAISGLLRKS